MFQLLPDCRKFTTLNFILRKHEIEINFHQTIKKIYFLLSLESCSDSFLVKKLID